MREGLENIMISLSPMTSSDWETVMNDVRRLLSVWESKESDAVARSVVLQIEDMLKEFSQPPKMSPKLLISESSRPPVISHVVDHQPESESDCESEVDDTCGSQPEHTKDEESEDVPEPDADVDVDADADADKSEPEVEEEEVEEEEVEEEEEPEDEVEAEVEMEVEQITVRGKTYWYDPSSRKLFAVLEDDEVGDEIGILVNGKIQALVKE